MNIGLQLNGVNYYKGVLKLVNIISNLRLTDTEMDLLAFLLSNHITIIDATSKEIMCVKLDKTKYDINNYVKSLKDKNIIELVEDPKIKYKIIDTIVNLFVDNQFILNLQRDN